MRGLQAEAGTTLTDNPRVAGREHRRSSRVWLVALVLVVAAAVYLLDRLTKAWALANLTPGVPQEFIGDWLRLNLIFNPGAAFSLGTGLTPLFTIMMVVVSLAIVVSWRWLGSWGWAVALGLLLGGAQGNLTDRLTRPPGFGVGHVVDFLQLPYWPVFNIADSSVVCAAVLVVILAVRDVTFSGAPRPHSESGNPDTRSAEVGGPGTGSAEVGGVVSGTADVGGTDTGTPEVGRVPGRPGQRGRDA